MNIRELPKGSFVQAWSNDSGWMLCQVVEVLRNDSVSVLIFHQNRRDKDYALGSIATFPLDKLDGVLMTPGNMKNFGFTDSDERGWKLVYWFGTDMKLLYRYDGKKAIAHFRFKSVYRKSYVRISCHHFHGLQNLIRFLTGGELEFEYKTTLYE